MNFSGCSICGAILSSIACTGPTSRVGKGLSSSRASALDKRPIVLTFGGRDEWVRAVDKAEEVGSELPVRLLVTTPADSGFAPPPTRITS